MPSESEIISRIRARARGARRVLVGIGDDAAVVSLEAGRDLIACCDLMVEGVHFRREWTPPKLLGHKALAVTLSDVAAMGALARFAMVSVALPPSTSSEFVDELFSGIFDLADNFDVAIIGGDTSSSLGSIFIDTSVIAECPTGRAITRAGAKPGDIIYVTGELGGSAMGLRLLEQGYRLEEAPSDDTESRVRRQALLKHLAPEPRLNLGQAIGEAGLATAMIDISDGLSTDLWHVLEESGCGAVIHAGAIPVARCLSLLKEREPGVDPAALALHGAEEYELLFTTHPDNHTQVLELAGSIGFAITVIGEMVVPKDLQLERRGVVERVSPSGFQHLI